MELDKYFYSHFTDGLKGVERDNGPHPVWEASHWLVWVLDH